MNVVPYAKGRKQNLSNKLARIALIRIRRASKNGLLVQGSIPWRAGNYPGDD